ncbi:7TM-DISM domain-containing protein [Shewanella basaltis]|uniref:7TMR-DISMED2 domain-containing protein n=1 Tax=Shewanella basaltis TaxID=472183 RepID=UPI003AAA9A4B
MLVFFCSFYVASKPIELTAAVGEQLINKQISIWQVTGDDVPFEKALNHFQQGHFVKNHNGKVSFGFTHDVIWVSVLVNNASTAPIKSYFYLDSAWLDHADFYFVRQNELVDKLATGDTLPFSSRSKPTRMIAQAYEYLPGSPRC